MGRGGSVCCLVCCLPYGDGGTRAPPASLGCDLENCLHFLHSAKKRLLPGQRAQPLASPRGKALPFLEMSFPWASGKTLSSAPWSWRPLSGSRLSWAVATSLLQSTLECSSTLENTNISQDPRLAHTNSPTHPLSLLTLFATPESKRCGTRLYG